MFSTPFFGLGWGVGLSLLLNCFLLYTFLFQIHEEARKFAYQTGVRVVVAYGGAPIHQQVFFAALFISA